jgi:hypothetical protein
VGHRYQARLNGSRISSAKLAAILGISTRSNRIGSRDLTASALCYTAQQTVLGYCHSADADITAAHVPQLRGVGNQASHDKLTDLVLPYAVAMWTDLKRTDEGRIPFKHDHYLKMWALGEPTLRGNFLLLDEAQDTNPVLEKVFTAQRGHTQLVMVGDSAQAIYGWRGARDVMSRFDGPLRTLSQSFRFGAAVAVEANRWLAIAGQPLRITGAPHITSTVTTPASGAPTTSTVIHPQAILCRTNGGAMTEILGQLRSGRRVALVGDGKALQDLALAARDLQNGRRSTHYELMLFSSWGEVQDYAQHDPTGAIFNPSSMSSTNTASTSSSPLSRSSAGNTTPRSPFDDPQVQRARMDRRPHRRRLPRTRRLRTHRHQRNSPTRPNRSRRGTGSVQLANGHQRRRAALAVPSCDHPSPPDCPGRTRHPTTTAHFPHNQLSFSNTF